MFVCIVLLKMWYVHEYFLYETGRHARTSSVARELKLRIVFKPSRESPLPAHV